MAAKKGGLGKGLDSLITDKVNKPGAAKDTSLTPTEDQAVMVPINKVEPNKEQPRKHFNEDALLELKTEVEKRGFKVIGAAAFPAEHSIVNSIGARRPNKADLKEASEYGISLNRIIKKEDSFASFDLKVPGNTPYRKYGKNVLFPKADVSLCTECSACAKICPAGAISLDNPKKTDHDKCIGCMKCVRFCKQKARYVSAFKLNMAAKKLTKVCQSDKKAEIFL
mgnify:CR=1 FL=1